MFYMDGKVTTEDRLIFHWSFFETKKVFQPNQQKEDEVTITEMA